MSSLPKVKAAKNFLAATVVAEAQREGVEFSEIERRMLYFTETYWTPYDFMETNEAFEKEYDTPAYEAKVASLIHAIRVQPEQRQRWDEAISVLRKEATTSSFSIACALLRQQA